VTARFKRLQRAPHAAIFVEAVFVEEGVEVDVDQGQAALDPGEHGPLGFQLEALPRLVAQGIAVRRDQLARNFRQVLALVALGGQGGGQTERLQIARLQALAEDAHLAARVVEVVFHFHVVAERGQDVGHCAADHPVARVADGERAGRVGADALDLGALAAPDVQGEDLIARGDDRVNLRQQPGFVQANVEEARRGDLNGGDEGRGRHVAGDARGHVKRLAPGEPGELHGDRAGVVALLWFAAALDRDRRREIQRRQVACRLRRCDAGADQGCELGWEQVHERHSSLGGETGGQRRAL